jgi:hypothetical protein
MDDKLRQDAATSEAGRLQTDGTSHLEHESFCRLATASKWSRGLGGR